MTLTGKRTLTVSLGNRLDKSSLARACSLSNIIPMGQPNTPCCFRKHWECPIKIGSKLCLDLVFYCTLPRSALYISGSLSLKVRTKIQNCIGCLIMFLMVSRFMTSSFLLIHTRSSEFVSSLILWFISESGGIISYSNASQTLVYRLQSSSLCLQDPRICPYSVESNGF